MSSDAHPDKAASMVSDARQAVTSPAPFNKLGLKAAEAVDGSGQAKSQQALLARPRRQSPHPSPADASSKHNASSGPEACEGSHSGPVDPVVKAKPEVRPVANDSSGTTAADGTAAASPALAQPRSRKRRKNRQQSRQEQTSQSLTETQVEPSLPPSLKKAGPSASGDSASSQPSPTDAHASSKGEPASCSLAANDDESISLHSPTGSIASISPPSASAGVSRPEVEASPDIIAAQSYQLPQLGHRPQFKLIRQGIARSDHEQLGLSSPACADSTLAKLASLSQPEPSSASLVEPVGSEQADITSSSQACSLHETGLEAMAATADDDNPEPPSQNAQLGEGQCLSCMCAPRETLLAP